MTTTYGRRSSIQRPHAAGRVGREGNKLEKKETHHNHHHGGDSKKNKKKKKEHRKKEKPSNVPTTKNYKGRKRGIVVNLNSSQEWGATTSNREKYSSTKNTYYEGKEYIC